MLSTSKVIRVSVKTIALILALTFLVQISSQTIKAVATESDEVEWNIDDFLLSVNSEQNRTHARTY